MATHIFRIFVSSTFRDLEAEREATARALHELTFPLSLFGIALIPTDLRRGASAAPPLAECLSEVERADLLVLLLGQCYGSETESGKSFTECEYDEASLRRIDRLAFIAQDPVLVLPEEKLNPGIGEKQRLFKEKVLKDLKCEFFGNADELRGHVMRDVLGWVLEQVPSSMLGTRSHTEKKFLALKQYFKVIREGNTPSAVALVTATEFSKDMRRFGIQSVHKAVLQDLLELGKLSEPTKVTDPYQRSRLLMNYIESFPRTVSTLAALAEAQQLEDKMAHPLYSFGLARVRAVAAYQEGQYDLAALDLEKMLRHAWATRDHHTLGQAYRIVGDFYAQQQDFVRSLRWQWKGVRSLIRVVDTCPFCLARAFHAAGRAHASIGECNLATDRFGKALMIARMIPDREMQSVILSHLGQHYDHHDMLPESIAAYVWASRLQRDSNSGSEATDPQLLIGDIAVRRGRERVREVLADVRETADEIVLESLKPYKLDDFTTQLDLKPSSAGDHW